MIRRKKIRTQTYSLTQHVQVLDGAIARDISRNLHTLAQGVASQPAKKSAHNHPHKHTNNTHMQVLDGAVARDISRGLHTLSQGVASQPALQGKVYGRLVDLIECPPQLDLAVENTAGGCGSTRAVLSLHTKVICSLEYEVCAHTQSCCNV